MKAYTSTLIINNNTNIIKKRKLPIKGKVLCEVGDSVNYDTIIAQGEIKGHLATFHFANELNIPSNEINKYLLFKEGDFINQGDILGETSSFFGLFKNKVKSPYNGTLEYINENTGNIGIRLKSTKIELNAYIQGKIKEIIPNEGAVIESYGTYIQGIFGIGGEKYGKLKILENINNLDNNLNNTILVINDKIDIELLRKLDNLNILGILTGSIDDNVIKEYIGQELGVAITGSEKVKMTIILTEGFGNIPMSENTFNILKNIENSFVSINGTTQIRAGVIRPEIIKSNNSNEIENKAISNELSIGSKVRIMSEPFLCQYGIVTKIFESPMKLETGNYSNCVEVEINNNKEIIPKTNIELICE